MELRQLRIFVAVAEELHFRRAAERVGMAQAALSAQVRALEDELGFPLLFRTTRHVSLTQAGAVFLNEARAVLGRADAAVDAARFPGVHAPLTEVTASVEQGFELLRHRVDVGFFRAPAADDAIAWEPLLAERVVAAMPAGHPLAARSAIGVPDLATESLIGYPRHARPVLHAMLWDAFRAAGLRPRVGFEAVEKATLLRLVAQGLGIGLVPQWVTLAPAPGVVFRPFADAAAPMRLGVGWRRAEDGETLRTFLALVREHARTTQAVLDAQAF